MDRDDRTNGRTTEGHHVAAGHPVGITNMSGGQTRRDEQNELDEWWSDSKEMCTHLQCGTIMYKVNRIHHHCPDNTVPSQTGQ